MADISTPIRLQAWLNNFDKDIRAIMKREILWRGVIAEIGECTIHNSKGFKCPEFFIAIRSYPEIQFFVFYSEEEAVNYCLDRFESQLELFKQPNQ